MGKPLSRPGCFRKSSCCLEKHGLGDGGVGGRDVGMEGGYGDGYVPQRSIYDTMCINQQIDSHHHHHHGGSIRRDGGSDGSFYSASGSLRVSRGPADMFDQQPRSLTPNPSFVRRLDERAIFDSLKLEGHDIDGGCHSPGDYTRSVSPAVSSFSAPGVSSSSKKHHHHHHHHHGDSTKSRDSSRHSWKVITPPKQLECMELTTADMIDRGGAYLNPGHYPPSAGQGSSLASPLISPFSGSPLSSGYHTPVFFSPAKPRPSQTQSLRCSPPHVMQPPSRHYSQTQSLRLSPPHELHRSPYRSPLVQLSAHDLEQDLRGDRSGWGRSEREREWERERERELERGWAQREWERERERGRLERERARERERRENSFGTFGYGRPIPLRSDRDSVFLEPDPMLDTTPLLLPQPSPSPSPSGAPRMGTCAVGRNRAGSKVGPDCLGGSMVSKYDNGNSGIVLVDGKPSCLPRLVSEVSHVSEAEMMAMQERHRAESWSKHNNGSRSSFKNEVRMGSQVKTRPGGRDLEGKVQSGMHERTPSISNKELHHRAKSMDTSIKVPKTEFISEVIQAPLPETEKQIVHSDIIEPIPSPYPVMNVEIEKPVEIIKQVEQKAATDVENINIAYKNELIATEAALEAKDPIEDTIVTTVEQVQEAELNETDIKNNSEKEVVQEVQKDNTSDKINSEPVIETSENSLAEKHEKKPLDIDKIESKHVHKGSKHKHKSSKSSSRSRPGTATGLRPGVLSPRLSRGLHGLESPNPAEGIESTWPRRIMVRKRTVRQGGALHNLPILPPLPSVLSALEKRRPHAFQHHHLSENPLSNITNSASIVGRCSLKEPSHSEIGQGISPVGRASLKEQNLESWRVCRDQDELQRSRSRDIQGVKDLDKEAKKQKELKKDKDRNAEREKREEIVIVEKENVDFHAEFIKEVKQEVFETRTEIRIENTKEVKELTEARIDVTISDDMKEWQGQELEEVVAKFNIEEPEGEAIQYRDEGESWDDVLGIVNTLWDNDGWEKGGAEVGEGDGDSLSGSLPRWPLLRPPVGFGGSHPPSSAASELSLTELERRARELDSDLEHLDLSQPHRENQDLYPSLHEQRDRPEMYQTHPGPQRDKASALTGVGSRSQVNLELSAMASPPAADADRTPVSASSAKEDSSPDSNLTLESDSSGIFLSLSNQSQEEAGSDSDQPISGSDLGSSSTSLDKDDGIKEWGREESAELQWCYPTLLNTSVQDDTEGEGGEVRHQPAGGNMESGICANGKNTVSIIMPPMDDTAPQDQELPPRKRVTVMGGNSPLCRSPTNQPIKHLIDPAHKPIRSSGLDCGDIDPFAQPDSFVYLAVSARPSSRGEVTVMTKGSPHNVKPEIASIQSDITAHFEQAKLPDVKGTHLTPQKPEEGDFLCTDSFVYLAAPACLLLGPPGTTPYSGRESDSESSDSGPVDVSVHGCGSVAGDSDWDSDLSDTDPSRPSRTSASGPKSSGAARSKRPPVEPDWDLYEEPPEPEILPEREEEENDKDTTVESSLGELPSSPIATPSVSVKTSTLADTSTTAKKVTWQFRPAQRSVCTGSRKDKEKEMTSSSLARFGDLEEDEPHRPPPSSSSSSSSSPSSSSSG